MPEDRDQADQQLQTNHPTLPVEPVVVIFRAREERKTLTFSSATRRSQQQVDQVGKEYDNITEQSLTGVGYGIHYPIRHGQIENWVG